jgi:hypothetical protein
MNFMATIKQVTASVSMSADSERRWYGRLKFEQKAGDKLFPWSPSEDVVAEYARLMVHPYQSKNKALALWHETYLDQIKPEDNTGETWVVTIVEPSMN